METTEPDAPPRPPAPSFIDVLEGVHSGLFLRQLSEAMADLTTAVRRQGKAGAIVIRFSVQPIAGNDEMVQIVPEMTPRMPRPKPTASTFFVTRDGGLSRDHPSQMTDPALQPAAANPEETQQR
ncbi:hypothetical protein [Patulibacter medicamentivorans]|nr:hypothetical protein [Patulibacter medicamentivorans]